MTTYAVELPESLVEQLRALPKEKVVAAFTETAAELVGEADWLDAEREETRAAIAEGIADADAGRYITFEAYIEQERAYFREKGIDFDAARAKVKPIMEG